MENPPPKPVRVFVSLTTIPPRMASLERCLDSLAAQTLRPERIFVCIPKAYRRFAMPDPLPFDLSRFGDLVEIVRPDQDFGPGTKLLGAVDRVPKDDDALLVLVDDDLSYRPGMLQTFADAFRERPDAAASFHVYRYRGLDVGQGADGFAIPAKVLAGIWPYHARVRKSAFAFFVDDLWISYYLWMNSVPIRSVAGRGGTGEGIYDVVNDAEALARQSGLFTRKRTMLRTRWFLRLRLGWQGLLMRAMKRLGRPVFNW